MLDVGAVYVICLGTNDSRHCIRELILGNARYHSPLCEVFTVDQRQNAGYATYQCGIWYLSYPIRILSPAPITLIISRISDGDKTRF